MPNMAFGDSPLIMNQKSRKKLFLSFVCIFFIATPILITYAIGYKINLTWPLRFNQILQKTGMLVINTYPDKASLYVNNKPYQTFLKKNYSLTPVRIKNILPKEYYLEIKKNNYFSWQKKINISSGKATIFENIILFKKTNPVLISTSTIIEIKQSFNKKYLAMASEKEVKLFNTSNNKFNLQTIQSNNKPNLQWTPDSKKFLINKNIISINNFFNLAATKIDAEKFGDLNKLLGQDIYNIKWDDNSNIAYYQNDNSFNSFDFDASVNKKILNNEEILDFLIKKNNLFYIAKVKSEENHLNNIIQLKIKLLENKEINKEIELPYSSQYSLVYYQNNLLNIYDARHKILYLVDPFLHDNSIVEIINNVKYLAWSENKLLYANDFEIWIFDLENKQKRILTRISEPISKIVWHPSNNYILYSTTQSINVLELDEDNQRNIIKLITSQKINSFFINKKADTVYFDGSVNSINGLYKLSL